MTITLASKATSVKRSLPSIPETFTASGGAVEAQTTLVIIDSGVEDYSVLAAGVLPNIKTVILDPNQDGVAQITEALQAHPHTTSLHIVSHGSPGCIYLGNTQLSLETLDRHSWDLQSWFSLLPNDSIAPSLLLYGCEVAEGDRGQAFVQLLSQLTGAPVAASTTKTGSTALGGNWNLDVQTGAIEAVTVFQPSTLATYQSVLPIIFSDSFANNNAGWTLGPEWQIGSATASSGQTPDTGNPDPAIDTTATSDNGVAGVVIGGNASTALHGFYYLTSPVIDANTSGSLTLQFQRWLNSDYTPFMQNVVEVYNGSTWTQVWASGGSPGIFDNAWNLQSYDITPYKSANTQVRFGFNIASSGVWTIGSWNIDDVTINNVNNAPTVGGAVSQIATEDATAFAVNLLSGASDADGDTLNVSNLSLTSGNVAGVTVNGNSLTVDSNAYTFLAVGESEMISYSYDITDGSESIAQTATITITGVNDAPSVGASVTRSATEDAAGFSVDLLAGATDVEGDTLNVSDLSLTSGSAAGITISGNSLTVDPNAYNSLAGGESEVITYGYNVTDGNGGSTAQTATITITGANDAPTITQSRIYGVQPTTGTIIQIDPVNGNILGSYAAPGTLSPTDRNIGLTVAEGGNSLFYQNSDAAYSTVYRLNPTTGVVLSTLSFEFSQGLSYQSGGSPALFTVSDHGDVHFETYTGSGFSSADYYAYDSPAPDGGIGGDDNGREFVFIDNGTIREYDPFDPAGTNRSPLRVFAAPASDVEGVAFDGTNLYVSTASGSLYTLNPDTGAVLNTITVSGGALFGLGAAFGGGSPQTNVTEDGVFFNLNLLAGVLDPDGDTLNVSNLSLTSGNAAGVTVNGNSLTVDPNAYNSLAVGESEVINYGYNVTDGNGGITPQTATITITGVNDAPGVGASVSQSATEDAAGFSVNLLAGATDVDGDTLNVSGLSLTSGSAAGITVSGNSLTVNPNAYNSLAVGESEVITYGYNVNDGNGGITPQTATITITGVNDAPSVGASVSQSATEDAAGFSVNLLAGATDVDGDTLNVSGLSLTSGSAAGITVSGNSLTVNPNAYNSLAVGESEVITYGYNVNDGNGGITPQTATITITGVNDAPGVGASVSQSATEDAAGFSVNLLAGATDVDGDTLNVSGLSLTSGSAAGITVSGNSLTVNPNAYNSLAAGQNQVITYGYNVNDGNGGITPQTATITITGVNDAPSLTSNAILPVVPEDSTNPTSQTISSLVGTFFSDPDAAASLSGVAVVGNTANAITEGKWQYSTDGAMWTDVGPVTDSVTGLALSATTELRFLPVAGYNGTPAALTIRALDNTYSGGFGTTVDTTTRGGSTAIAAATNTISTTVLPSADVTSVSATTLDGAYNGGDAIAITVTFDEIVNVTGIGIPQLTLETGTTDAIANYSSGSGTNTLTFLYTVGAGETSVDLDYLSTTALSLNDGSIRNASGIDANLTLPTPGAANSLGANKSLVIDTTAPAIPAIASFTTDSGVAGDNITNDTTLTLSGTAEADSTVSLTLDGTAAGTVVAGPSGNWTYTPAVLSEGTHTLSAIATDAAGNSSAASPVLSLLIDTTAPATPAIPDLTTVSDTGRSNTDNITNDTTPTFNGTAEANSTVSVFSGTTLLGRAIADPVGSWTFTAAALASGNYSITTQVMDAAGNTSAPSPALALTIDTAAPTAPMNLDLTTASDRGVSSTDNKTSETKPTFTGAAEANSIVELFAGTQSLGVTTTDATGNWSFSVPTALAAGSYNITTQATDVAGNASPSSTPLMLTIQTVVPTVSTLNITPDVRDTNVGIVSLQFSEAVTNFDLTALTLTHEGVVISLVGAILTSQDNRTWVLELPSALTTIEGRYQLSVSTSTITSTAGNPLAAGTSDTWLVGYTATAFAPIDFQGERLTGIRIRGTNESERFEGTFRSDLLMGMGGHDVLIAGFGKAQFGVDRLYGGNGNDILISGNGKDLLYGERGRDRLLGGNGSDYLDGGSDGDRLLGGKGNDVLVGGTGNDMLSGKAGKDTFVCNTLNEGMDIVTDFNGAEDLLDLRNIMRQSGFGGDNAFARFTQYVQLHQVGANTEVRIDTDGNRSGQDFTTVLTLKNTTLSTVNSRQFVIV